MSERFPTRYASAEQSPGLHLWRVSNRWQREVRAALAPFGLTHTQFTVLAVTGYLGSLGEAVHQAKVAETIGLDEMTTSQVVRTLAQKGLITREKSTSDSRRMHLTLSERATQDLTSWVAAVEQVDVRFFGVLGQDEPRLSELLARL